MHRFQTAFATFGLAAVSLVLVPAAASASPASRRASRTAHATTKARGCTKSPIEVVAGAVSSSFSLTRCDGTALPSGIEQLSSLARSGGRPNSREPHGGAGRDTARASDLAPGVRRIVPGLVERLELVVDHFRKDEKAARVVLVSGYRPRSAGSYHAAGRALDLRIEGVKNEAVVAFCKTLADTGCGYYPNSPFVHIDARDPGTGHVAWIDASHPGETPRYVTTWPPPAASADDDELPQLPVGEHSLGRDADELPAASLPQRREPEESRTTKRGVARFL